MNCQTKLSFNFTCRFGEQIILSAEYTTSKISRSKLGDYEL